MTPTSPEDDRPVTREELASLFVSAEKPPSEFRIGGEAEKIGIAEDTFAPLPYAGPRGVERIFEFLVREHGWKPEPETAGGPVIALTRGKASITLEPGAQFELSGAPHEDVHAVEREMREHLEELAPVSRELGIAWLGVGFHPFASQAALPWVPKHRYGVMKRYLPERGSRGLDMMRRTATVQANFDYSSEADAMTKLVVLLRLSPLIHAMTANSPFIEGRVSTRKSERGDVWLHMDPSRSGLVRAIAEKSNPTYEDYVEWALDAGMFLFRRGESFVHNTGQTFRAFLRDGFEGHRATFSDWALHVNTLFPEARLKRTLEARSCDMLPGRLVGAVPALLTGILYDARSLDRARELALRLSFSDIEASRPLLVERALDTTIGGVPARAIAEELMDIAAAGLERRGKKNERGEDERIHLVELLRLVSLGRAPADDLVEGLREGDSVDPAELLRRTRI